MMLVSWVLAPVVHAQTNIGLNIQMYSGLSVTGTVGQVYQVQYATGLSDTNTWNALQHFELKWNPHEFVDTTCPATERRFYRVVEVEVPTNVVPAANMVFIPPGAFVLGSPYDEPRRWPEEGPQTIVTISRGFWMSKHEVTQGEYLSMMDTNPSYFRNGVTPPPWGGIGGPVTNELRHPVEMVSWLDATDYCEELTTQEIEAGRIHNGYAYRLPTEAEWEYACRAGTSTAFHYGRALRSGMANFEGIREYPPCAGEEYYCGNPLGVFLDRTSEVGSYAPNPWGLYDMHGNVFELCQDTEWDYPGGSVTDPQGNSTSYMRAIRGGDFIGGGINARSASRDYAPFGDGYDTIGFRVVLAPGQP